MAADDVGALQTRALEQIDHYLKNGAWGAATNTKGVEFKTCPHATHDINVFFGSKTLSASQSALVEFCWDRTTEAAVKEFDSDCLSWSFDAIDDNHRCVYQLNKLGWPIWNRSFVSLWFKHQDGDRITIGYTAMTNPKHPEKPKDDVRGFVSFTGMIFEPLPDGKTKLTRIMHIDPAGSLSSSIVNRLGGRQIVDYIVWLEGQVH